MQLPEHTADLVVSKGRIGGIHHHDKFHLGIGHVAIHLVVLSWVEQAQVQLPLVHQCFSHGGDLLIHHIQGRVHHVVELELILCGSASDVQRVIRVTQPGRPGSHASAWVGVPASLPAYPVLQHRKPNALPGLAEPTLLVSQAT